MDEQKSQSPTKSPLPPQVKGMMSFSDALAQVAKGKKITKLGWKSKEFYGVLRDTILMLHKPDGRLYQWIINEGDILGDDYVVI